MASKELRRKKMGRNKSARRVLSQLEKWNWFDMNSVVRTRVELTFAKCDNR